MKSALYSEAEGVAVEDDKSNGISWHVSSSVPASAEGGSTTDKFILSLTSAQELLPVAVSVKVMLPTYPAGGV